MRGCKLFALYNIYNYYKCQCLSQPAFCDKLIDTFQFQLLVAGQGLNDDMWHTLRFSRRSNSLKFQVDDETPIRGVYI